MANTSILAAFERMWLHVTNALSGKADVDHNHDSRYYTKTEIDNLGLTTIPDIDTIRSNAANGQTAYEMLADVEALLANI